MTKKYSVKKALIASVLSLVLCCSMLVGTTFAWFTDSVTSANNIIVAGNLDVGLEYKKVVDGVTDANWAEVTDQTKDIFDPNALWEPGHVEIAYLKVSNLGSLALKYQLSVKVAEEILGKTKDNADIKLSDHLVFKVIEIEESAVGTLDRTSAKADTDALGLSDYVGDTKPLDAKDGTNDEDFVALIVYMPTSVGNDANHNGTNVPSIQLGVSLFATQFESEKDSFDEFYDKDAPIAWSGKTNMDWYLANPTATEFVLSTAEELAGLAAIVNGTAQDIAQDTFSGQTIKLASDIDLGNLSWTTIGKNHDDEGADPFKGTFDGQGHTVYNLNIYIEDNKRDSVGFIGLAQNATIKGLTLQNVNINADYFVGAIVGKLSSGEIYDCHVKGDINVVARRNYAAGIVGDGYYDMENCSVIAEGTGKITSKAVAGGLCGRINEGAHNIKNCTVKNLDIQSGQQIAAISGFVHYGNTISGCNVENVDLTLTAAEVMKPAIGLASGLWYYKDNAPITMSDNVFKNITISAINNVAGTTNILYGWEWSDNLTGVVESNNTLENVTNNLNYQ